MIDLHTHLLPGVDDGSPTLEHSATILARFADEGVRGVVCTPHLRASEAGMAPVTEHAELRRRLQELSPPGLTLYGGWEVMLDDSNADLHGGPLALGSSRAMLVEWPRGAVPAGATRELLRLRGRGVVPLLAHVERYRGVTLELVREWRELGTVTQSDATILIAGGAMSDFARSMLEAGLVDVLASDNHGDRRSLSTARAWLEEIGAGAQGEVLTSTNPGRLLRDESLLPVTPVRFERSMFQRLRGLFRRR